MSPPGSDLVSSLLATMQVSGSVLMHAAYASPWAVELPESQGLARLLGLPAATQVMAFHLVLDGEVTVETEGGSHRTVVPGQAIILFRGGAHRVRMGDPTSHLSLSALLAGRHPPAPGVGDERAELVCGAFTLQHTRLNPLFSALPSVAVLDMRARGEPSWLASVGDQLVRELRGKRPGADFVVGRLLELFCAAAVRETMDAGQPAHRGWFAALGDRAIRAALEAIHEQPAAPWSVEVLAARASLSRSRFAARFAAVMGEPPMVYLTRWRMHVSAQRLATTADQVQAVAAAAGYASLPAFSRAFKQHHGLSPAQYRRARR